MRLLVRTPDAESFLRALTIAVPDAAAVIEIPEMYLIAVDDLPPATVARLEDLGAWVRPAPWLHASRRPETVAA
ncbi:hypothetical protein [Roseospira goensis]|uniref:Uncharacterized protein n=1 Tax=Roseospira goensis TaxID=391922 RepID=A0A7W6S012_9PROT|nr:hypothetical protein [Roseospira goensis]MBB4286384.1 hypothetical protein [Roseospira goensis]